MWRGGGDHTLPLNNPKGELPIMIKQFLRDETGAELAEYAVGVALLVAIGIVVYKVLGDAVNTSNKNTGSKILTADYK
jgi:Flp pilus assembly pilin Flp